MRRLDAADKLSFLSLQYNRHSLRTLPFGLSSPESSVLLHPGFCSLASMGALHWEVGRQTVWAQLGIVIKLRLSQLEGTSEVI